jgi:hypothetical protein
MFSHLLHLLVRSFIGIPAALGSTALGILFPVLVALLGEAIAVKLFGWKQMIKNWKKATGVGFAALGVGYTVLFCWLVVRNVYEDHLSLVEKISAMKQSSHGLNASLSMLVEGSGANGGLLIFTSVNLENGIGPDRPVEDWSMELVVDGKTVNPTPVPFAGDVMSVPVPRHGKTMIFNRRDYCPIVTENPLPSGASRSCWLMGVFDLDVDSVAKKNITAIISFKDLLSGETREMQTEIGPDYDDFPWDISKK